MRRGFILGALIACLIFLFSGAAFGQVSGSEHIVRADITVRFDKDGSVSIREALDYVKPRGVAKRGIFRELPLKVKEGDICLLYTSPSPRDQRGSRMPSSA